MKMRYAALAALALIVILAPSGATSAQGTTTHVVQPGETLGAIARQYGVTVEAIAFANGITNPNLIFAGQVLVIPVTAPATPAPGQTPAPGSTTTYTVASGDTLFAIARRFGTTITALVSLNNLTNPDRLDVGQVLKIPTQGPVTPAPTQAATATPSARVTYVVQAGDTLSRIALRFNTSAQEIALLNGLTNPDLIFVGQLLVIQQASTAPTGTPSATQAATQTSTSATATQSGTGTAAPSATSQATATQQATPTLTPTATPTPTPTATFPPEATLPPGFKTPTPLVPRTPAASNATNLLANGDFEAGTHTEGFDDVAVVDGWAAFYCDKPYTADFCPALRIGAGNSAGLLMSRPSYAKAAAAFRVHGGQAAQSWSCSWAACRAGVYQTIQTKPGASCQAGAYVQSWSSNDPLTFTSQLLSFDDRANSTWTIKVDLSGKTQAFADGLGSSRGFGYDDGIYDRYAPITFDFIATESQTTVFFEDLRLWPFANNSSFIDDAYVNCSQ